MSNYILKKLRKNANLTQKQVAKALCVDTSTYAKIEQGRNRLVDTYYEALAEIFHVDKVELFRKYSQDEEKGCAEGGVTMSMQINKVLDFGKVKFYGYDDFMFEEFGFGVNKDKASSFIDYINKNISIINTALKQIDNDCDTIDQCCYNIENVDEEGNIEFFANVAYGITINGHWVRRTDRGDMLSRILHEINDLEPDNVMIKCKLVTGECEGMEVMQLQLEEIEIDEKLLAGLDLENESPNEKTIPLVDLPEELDSALCNYKNRLRSIDDILDIAKRNNFPLSEDDARYLFKIHCC